MRRPYFAASAMIAAASLALAGTASAQDGTAASAGEKLNMVIIYGNDSCPVKKTSSDVQFSKLIDQERQKRLSTIDKQAAETQSDVEQAEAAYDARQRAEAARKAGVEARPAQ